MKKALVILLMGVIPYCVSSAQASDSIDFKVNGNLTMGACTPSMVGGDSFDYGDIWVKDLSATSDNSLDNKELTLKISCGVPQKVGLQPVDDRIDSEPSNDSTKQYFGLGFVDDVNKVPIGKYQIYADTDVTVDGKTDILTFKDVNGNSWHSTAGYGGAAFSAAGLAVFSVTTAGNTQPVAFTDAEFTLTAITTVQKTNTLNIKENTPLDGLATISLVYL